MPLQFRRLTVAAIVCVLLVPAVGRSAAVRLVDPSALQKLLPAAEGWTVSVVRSEQVVLSPEASYTFSSVALTKGDTRVKVQISDTGGVADSLTALAMIVVSMPPDFSEEVGGATIKRLKIGGAPAAEVWDSTKNSGEITAVVGGRFVVTVDSSKVDHLDTLRDIFEKVDLKAVEALK